MMHYYFSKLMMWIGYRKVWYFPSDKGLPISDFYKWEYHPNSEKRVYRENDTALRDQSE